VCSPQSRNSKTRLSHLGQAFTFDQPGPPVKQSEERRSTKNGAKKSSDSDAVVDRRGAHTAGPSVTSVKDVRRAGSSGRATSEIFVALLRSSLGTGAAPTSLAECDWGRFALLSTHHGLVRIIYRALRERAASVPA